MKEYDETNRKTLVEELETSIELKNLDSNQSQTSIHEEKEISRNSQILGDNKEFEKHESLLIDVEKKTEKLIILYIIKDYLMITFLLLSSSVNFSIPYIPFIILGITYIFLSLRFKYNALKRIIEFFSLLYSFLLLVVKVIIWTLINKNYFEYDDYSSFFHNFGIKIDDNEKFFEIFISLIGEISLFLISIISFIISRMYKDFDFNNISFSNESFNTKIQAIIYLGYISILFNAIYNKSFLTIIYLIFYQILIILFSKKRSFDIFRTATIVYLILLTIQLLLINIFNIYSLQKKFLEINAIKEENKIENYYSIFSMIGINYSYYHSLLIFFYEWLSYSSCVSTIVLFTIAQRIFLEKKDFENNKNIHENYLQKNAKNKSVWGKIKKIY